MDQIDSIIETEKPDLSSDDRVALRDTISRIEARIRFEKPSEQVAEGFSSRTVLLRLIKVGLELQNTDLLLILAARLKLAPVALMLQSSPQLYGEKGKLFALSYVADHFHINDRQIKEKLLSLNYDDCDTIYDLRSLVNLYIESNDWKKASEFSKVIEHCKSLNRLICSKLAQQYEAMENFYEALVNYESSGTQLENSVRVIIKQFLDSSSVKLKEYCLTNESLRSFWNEFSLFCPLNQSQDNQAMKDRFGSGLLGRRISWPDEDGPIRALADRSRKFISESSSAKIWLNKRTLESIMSSSASVELGTRRQLSQLAWMHRQSKCFSRACALFLCLDEAMVVSQLSSHFLTNSDVSQLNLILGLPDAAAVNIMRLIRTQPMTVTTRQARAQRNDLIRAQEQESLFFSALNLGLLDETVRCYCNAYSANDDAGKQVLDNLENLAANRHIGSLDRIDPTIRTGTLSMVSHLLVSERIPVTTVISIIIYCIAIYIYKLDSSHSLSMPPIRVMRQLEAMFECASKCMQEHTFNATSSLIRSTSLLVTAIKDKLELVSDSEIMRAGVKNLVESVASRCLVESQFKQAATLYSQIEDHASAIKSLMRLGDIDTVMNYSMLVRDITVNRLTINYLKHLDVDSGIIEEFITKSQRA